MGTESKTNNGESVFQLELRPVEKLIQDDVLQQQYLSLAQQDLHLADIFFQALEQEERTFHPAQVQVVGKDIWVDVLAEVDQPQAANALREWMEVRGQTGRFVSGRVLTQNLPQLAETAVRLQAARPITPALYRSVQDIHADHTTLIQNQLPGYDGREVIIGIVDFGGDFFHPNFRTETGESRLLYLWDQRGTAGSSPAKYIYGREYNQAELTIAIAAGLAVQDPQVAYQTAGYTPTDKAHGTHVMDIAAGHSSNYPGVAPEADLIFVHLGLPDPIVRETGTLGSTTRLYEAVEYIFDKADALGRPCVVNISLAENGGPHDGTTLVEQILDSLLTDATGHSMPGRAIVIAAGNSYQTRTHVAGTIAANGSTSLSWVIEARAPINWWQQQELEIWYPPEAELVLEIITPKGQSLGTCRLGETQWAVAEGTAVNLLRVVHRRPDNVPGEDENLINIFIDDRQSQLPVGQWLFRLRRLDGGADIPFHAWIERNDKYPSHFTPADCETTVTLNTIGNATWPIVVGAYAPDNPQKIVSYFSSAGPSRNHQRPEKPDLLAPGENILAARATHVGGTVMSGTSMAAPHVTGIVALLFQAAREEKGEILTGQEVREALLSTATHAHTHDARSGFGRVDALAALQKVLT